MKIEQSLVLILAPLLAGVAAAQEPAGDPIYRNVCSLCHERRIGPVILGRHIPAAAVRAVVRHGQNGMPAFRPAEISDAELGALADFVERSAAPGEARK